MTGTFVRMRAQLSWVWPQSLCFCIFSWLMAALKRVFSQGPAWCAGRNEPDPIHLELDLHKPDQQAVVGSVIIALYRSHLVKGSLQTIGELWRRRWLGHVQGRMPARFRWGVSGGVVLSAPTLPWLTRTNEGGRYLHERWLYRLWPQPCWQYLFISFE